MIQAKPHNEGRKKKKESGEKGSFLRVTLVRSLIGHPAYQRQVVRGLGLRKVHSQVVRPDEPAIRGMIKKISHLVKVEVINRP